jgi:predicted KAP-like P-loop ATPase
MFRFDQPINSYKEDLLGRHSFGKALAKAILSYNLDDSLSVGLYGEWGSGKTSLINMILEEVKSISSNKDPFIINFNPWNFSDQNQLIQQFFNELSLVLCRDDSADRHVKIGRTIQKYSKFFEPFSYVPALSIIGETAKAVKGVGVAAEQAGEDGSGPHCLDSLIGKLSSEPVGYRKHQAASANG